MAEGDNMKDRLPQTPEEVAPEKVGSAHREVGKVEKTLRTILAAGAFAGVVGAKDAHAQEDPDQPPPTPIGLVGDGLPRPPTGDEEVETAGADVNLAAPEGAPLEDSGVTEIALAPETSGLLPSASNPEITAAVSQMGWSAEQSSTFTKETGGATNWLMQVSDIYQASGDAELIDSMSTYVALMGNTLGEKERVGSVLFPSFDSRNVNEPISFNIAATPNGQIRYTFRYSAVGIEANNPSQNEHSAFKFLHEVKLFQKYRGLVGTLPEGAFADIPALVRWLNSDDVKLRLQADVYDKIPEIYNKVLPRIQALGLAESKFYSDIYKRWKFYSSLPASRIPAGYDRRIYTYQWVNDNLYGGKYQDRLRFKNPIPVEGKTLESFLKPLDIPW